MAIIRRTSWTRNDYQRELRYREKKKHPGDVPDPRIASRTRAVGSWRRAAASVLPTSMQPADITKWAAVRSQRLDIPMFTQFGQTKEGGVSHFLSYLGCEAVYRQRVRGSEEADLRIRFSLPEGLVR